MDNWLIIVIAVAAVALGVAIGRMTTHELRYGPMLVILRGTDTSVATATGTLIKASKSAIMVSDSIMMIDACDANGKQVTAETVRDFVGRELGVEVIAITMTTGWASRGCEQLVAWLRA